MMTFFPFQCHGIIQNRAKNVLVLPVFVDAFGHGNPNLIRVLRYMKDFLTTHLGLKNEENENKDTIFKVRKVKSHLLNLSFSRNHFSLQFQIAKT